MAKEAAASASEPRDPKNFVYIIFYWLGIGTLLPWNFFISVPGYWNAKWETVPVAGDDSQELEEPAEVS